METRKDNEHMATPLNEYTRITHEYKLPNVVRQKLEADIQQSQSIAIVITLLAATLATLTSILGGVDATVEGDSKGIEGLRLIMWIAIMSDVAEAFLCIMAIKMCVELPLVAMEKQVDLLEKAMEIDRPGDIERYLTVGPKELRHRHEILEAVGMPRSYRYIDRLVIWFLLWSVVLSIATMFYWVGQTINIFPAGVILIFFGLISVMLLTIFLRAMDPHYAFIDKIA